MNQRGQLLIVIAILISVALLLLAVAVDGGRLFLERNRMARGAQSAADAGVGVAAEKMAELAQARKEQALQDAIEAAEQAQEEQEAQETAQAGLSTPVVGESTPTPESTSEATAEIEVEFEPCSPEPQCWLTDDDWAILDGGTLRSAVEQEALTYARLNGFDENDSATLGLEVEYVVDFAKESLEVSVLVRRRATILLVGLLRRSFVELEAHGVSRILSP